MNQRFSFHRFWLLLKLDFAENGRSYLFITGLIIAVMLLLMTPVLATREFSDTRYLLHPLAFFICVWLGGSLFTSITFAQYSGPAKGIPALMLPASRPEKFLVALLVNLFFIVLFIVLFWQLHHLFIDFANRRMPTDSRGYMPIPPGPTKFLTYNYFLIQGGMFLGSIYFPKNAFLKTAVTLLIVILAISGFHYTLANQFAGNPSALFTIPFSYWNITQGSRFVIKYPEPVDTLIWIFLLLLIAALWGIAYVRLREKEI